jgi:fucose 4-O-acetylase-like acetyltransferase
MKERIVFLDAIRGFAILLVVMGHAVAWNYPDWHEVCLFSQTQSKEYMVGGAVWQLIYSFHMALFFMVSGYLSGVSAITKDNVISRIKTKTNRLLIPYLATGFLIYFVRGNWGYWFLLTLYEISIVWMFLNVVLRKLNPRYVLWKDVIIMALAYGFLRGLSLIPVIATYVDANLLKYFIPFCFGCLMRRYSVVERMVKDKNIYTFCIVLFFLLFISRYLTEYPLLYTIVEKVDFFFSISALCACIVVFSTFMNGVNCKTEKLFAYLGKVSMPIYILHNLFVIQIAGVGVFVLMQNPVTSITMQIVYSLAVSVIAISLSLFLYYILRRSALIRLLMFGERS